MAQSNDITVDVAPRSHRGANFPWHLLAWVGDKLILRGKFLQPSNVAVIARQYAKRNGFTVTTRRLGPGVVEIVRTT